MGNKIEKCEDVLNGLKVNWAGYEPPGGETWRKVFVEEIGPLLRKSRADAVKELESIMRNRRNLTRMKGVVQEIREKTEEVARILDELGFQQKPDVAVATSLALIQTNISPLEIFSSVTLEKANSQKDIAEIEEDIKFFDAFEAMVEADAELDKMLYAMLTVEDKYRVKLLRASCRMLTVVEENREVVRRSKSVVSAKIKGVVAQIIATLDGAYAVTSVYLRQLKKDYAHHGIAALASLVAPELPRQTIPENLKISTGVA